MTLYWSGEGVDLWHGNCVVVMAQMPEASIDAIVTDPPYDLTSGKGTGGGFMGKQWDATGVAFDPATWRAALRVLKPGGHLLAFGGSRTWHRLAVAVEDAGFEIRDSIAWLYGSGFPKSLDVSKAIDKARDDRDAILAVTTFMADAAERASITRADVDERMGTSDMGGWWLSRLRHRCQVPKWDQWLQLKGLIGFPDDMDAEVWRLNGRKGTPGEAWGQREKVGEGFRVDRHTGAVPYGSGTPNGDYDIAAPATDAARQWEGWGTALKPAFEPVIVARKPLIGTVAQNVQAHGTGALNINACRIGDDKIQTPAGSTPGGWIGSQPGEAYEHGTGREYRIGGRWPANVALDADMAAVLDQQSGVSASKRSARGAGKGVTETYGAWGMADDDTRGHNDSGGASRYFFVAQPDEEPEWHGDGSTKAASTSAGKRTEGRLGNSHTGGSGNKTPAQSPPDTRSTIGITTHSTTASTTSCASPQSGTTTITNGSVSDTAGSTDKSSDSASAAPLGSDSTVTTSGAPEHGRDTASPVSAQRTVNGSQPTGSTSTHLSERSRLPVEQLEARFRYEAKASTAERPKVDGVAHSTVKPIDLIQWLVRLVTPPGGVVLDPFAGSGTTGEAAIREGFTTVLIEQEAEYLPLIRQRFDRPINYVFDFGDAS